MKFAIWDIDNCIADDGPRIPLIDWSSTDPRLRYENYHNACMGDRPGNLHIFLRVSKTFTPLFITGRPESVRSQTQLWLSQLLPSFGEAPLLMRPMGCELPSVDLKLGLLRGFLHERKLQPQDIAMAFDDHSGIIEMYKDQFGIPAQVLKIHELDAYKGEHELVRGDGGHQAYLDKREDAGPAPVDAQAPWFLTAEAQAALEAPIEELGPVQGAKPVVAGFGATLGGGLEMRIARNPPPRKVTADQILEQMAATFRERNGQYRNNSRMVPKIVAALFPDGVPQHLPTDEKWHLFELVLVKLTRFAASELTHADSIHDAAVYCAMIEAINKEQQQ